MSMEIRVETKIYPSEDSEKVSEVVRSIFPELKFELGDDRFVGEADNFEALENFKNKLGLQAIRDSARRELKKGRQENKISFDLNKQAAAVDKISFSHGETPLGPIRVTIRTEDEGEMDKLIDYLAPSTKDK